MHVGIPASWQRSGRMATDSGVRPLSSHDEKHSQRRRALIAADAGTSRNMTKAKQLAAAALAQARIAARLSG
jgi:hypothetical protein